MSPEINTGQPQTQAENTQTNPNLMQRTAERLKEFGSAAVNIFDNAPKLDSRTIAVGGAVTSFAVGGAAALSAEAVDAEARSSMSPNQPAKTQRSGESLVPGPNGLVDAEASQAGRRNPNLRYTRLTPNKIQYNILRGAGDSSSYAMRAVRTVLTESATIIDGDCSEMNGRRPIYKKITGSYRGNLLTRNEITCQGGKTGRRFQVDEDKNPLKRSLNNLGNIVVKSVSPRPKSSLRWDSTHGDAVRAFSNKRKSVLHYSRPDKPAISEHPIKRIVIKGHRANVSRY